MQQLNNRVGIVLLAGAVAASCATVTFGASHKARPHVSAAPSADAPWWRDGVRTEGSRPQPLLVPVGQPGEPMAEDWLYDASAPTLSSPRLEDVDGNGIKDIIVSTYDPVDTYAAGVVHVIDVAGNHLPGWPQTTSGPIPASPAVADIDDDGDMEVIVGSWQQAYVWNHDGTSYPGWPKPTGSYNSPAVADLDGDDDLEIIYTSTNKRLYVWHHDGSTMSGWPYTAPEAIGTPAVADIDGDGELEIAAGTYAGPVGPDPFEVYVWESNGTVVPGFPVPTSGVVKAAIAVGDVDDDGAMEIVACGYHTSNNDFLYVWDAQGNLEPGWPIQVSYARLSGPSLGDLDGDDDLEIMIGGLDPAPFPERVFAFHHDGTDVAGWPVTLTHAGGSGNVNSSLIIADVDGDTSMLEVFVKVKDHIFALHSDGTIVTGFQYFLSDDDHSGTFSPSPAVGDCDGDGDAEFVFVASGGMIAYFDEPGSYSTSHEFWPMFKHDAHNTSAIGPVELADCPADISGDGDVGFSDLLAVLSNWGPCVGCPEDIDGNDDVGFSDLLGILSLWGPCPP